MGRLADALEDALAGRGRLIMVSGEQGIGKTRLAMELADQSERRDARVLWGRCYEREGAPPYWPWVQVIRAYVDRCDPQFLGSDLRRQAATVAEIVPEVRERIPGLSAAPAPRDPKEARFLLMDSVASFLKRAAAKQAITIVLDNLHASDAGSLLMLEFVARELADARLLVVGTYRDVELQRGHRLVETLAELTREQPFERLPLGGLTEAEVVRLIETSVSHPPPLGLAEAVHRQAEGNPLFVTEVVRLLVQEHALTEGSDTASDWSLRVPEGVRAVIGRRLDQLSAECNDMLRLASIVGREFSLRQLSALVDDPTDDVLLPLLQEALGARIIEELPATVDRYQFTHRLIQETLATELSTTQRVRLHARIAEALEQLYGDRVEHHAPELAHHFAEAETVLGPEALIRYSHIAGEQALVAHSYEEAYAYFRQALDAKEGQPMDDETAALLFGLARSEFASRERYDLGDALGHMRRAFMHFAESGDERRAVEVAAHPVPYVYGSPEAADLAARALAMVKPSSGDAGQLLSTLGWFRGMTDYGAAREAFARSAAIARNLGDTALERRALVSEAHVDFWHLEYERCLEKSLRAAALALDARDERTEMMALSEATRMCATLGKPAEAEMHALRMLELADKFRERYWLVTARVNRLWLTVLTGDWEAARALSEEGLGLQPRDARNLASRALVERQVGDGALSDAFVERLVDARWLSASEFAFEDACVAAYLPLIGRIAGTETRLGRATEAAEAVHSSEVVVPLLDLYCRVGRGFAAMQRGDAARAAEEHGALLHLRGTALALLGMTADRLLGLLSVTAGDVEAALLHFERGLDFCRRTGYRPEYAWTASDYAEVLIGLPRPDARMRATELRAEALSIARELGMRPLIDRVLSSEAA
jgi:tetratricopeptide (TPR) repeat protein